MSKRRLHTIKRVVELGRGERRISILERFRVADEGARRVDESVAQLHALTLQLKSQLGLRRA